MIHYVKGNLLDSNCDYICHQVNCRGVMGSGIARQIRERWPRVFVSYRAYCDRNKLRNESPLVYEGNEDSSADVARNLFSNKRYSEVLSFRGTSECNQHVFVIAGEIAAFAISVA